MREEATLINCIICLHDFHTEDGVPVCSKPYCQKEAEKPTCYDCGDRYLENGEDYCPSCLEERELEESIRLLTLEYEEKGSAPYGT